MVIIIIIMIVFYSMSPMLQTQIVVHFMKNGDVLGNEIVGRQVGPCRSDPEEGQVSFLGAASLTCLLLEQQQYYDFASCRLLV
jgi:hypothetical protein